MKKSKDPIARVQIILTEPIHKAIVEFAEKKGWNVSQCIRDAIKLYIHEKSRKRKGEK